MVPSPCTENELNITKIHCSLDLKQQKKSTTCQSILQRLYNSTIKSNQWPLYLTKDSPLFMCWKGNCQLVSEMWDVSYLIPESSKGLSLIFKCSNFGILFKHIAKLRTASPSSIFDLYANELRRPTVEVSFSLSNNHQSVPKSTCLTFFDMSWILIAFCLRTTN